MNELMTPDQMALADKLAIQAGCSGIELMENAGTALLDMVGAHFSDAESVLISLWNRQ